MLSSEKSKNATGAASDRPAERNRRQKQKEQEDIAAHRMFEEEKLKIEEEDNMKTEADTALKEETKRKVEEEEDIAAH